MNTSYNSIKKKYNLGIQVSNFFCLYPHTNRKKRAVSEIIVTLLLVGITVVGGIFLMNIFSSTQSLNVSSAIVNPSGSSVIRVKMIGYDARDGSNLSGISTIDNTNNGVLCATTSCSTKEYIVLKIQSLGTSYIDSILVNEVVHTWDSSTAGVNLLTSSGPAAGKFSIISTSNTSPITQKSGIQSIDQDIRLVIRLNQLSSNISIGDIIRVTVTPAEGESATFLVPAGSAA